MTLLSSSLKSVFLRLLLAAVCGCYGLFCAAESVASSGIATLAPRDSIAVPCVPVFAASPLDIATTLPCTAVPDSNELGALRLHVSSLAFFKDNEFDGNISKGYTLPGFWLQPRLSFVPHRDLRFELGFHALVYDGADKYPNYAYRDIERWKGSQYQSGAHVLPFFRAEVRLGAAQFVVGSLYGGGAHGLITPLYNPEMLLSADPEMGLQLRLNRQRYQLDSWIDWQSFIFDKASHQEAFIFGTTQRILLRKGGERGLSLVLPLQVLAQHRGGEQDTTSLGVQTVCNASAGLVARYALPSTCFNAFELEAHALLTYQQSGQMLPFGVGKALWVAGAADLRSALRLRVGFFAARDFASLLGAPFFGTLSVKEVGGRFSHIATTFWNVEYVRHFGKHYAVGAQAQGYLSATGSLLLADGSRQAARLGNAFSLGFFLRANPHFLLKRLF